MAIRVRGGEGGRRQGFQCLWAPPGDGELLQIPMSGDLCNRLKLSVSDEELGPGKDGVE